MKNRRGILAVIGSAAAIFWPGAFIFGYPGVMGPLWQQRFGVGRGAIGNTLFFVLVAVGCFMFFVGRWQERWGTRRMILLGAVLFGLNQFLVAFADRLWMIYAWAFINGATASFIYIPGLTTVQRWFPEKRGLVSGIVNLVYGLSAAVMSPLFGTLLLRLGYQSMNILLAWTALTMGILAALATDSPEGVGTAGAIPGAQRAVRSAARTFGYRRREPSILELLVPLAHLGTPGCGGHCPGHSGGSLRAGPAPDPGLGGNDPHGLQSDQRVEPTDHGLPLR